MSITVHYRAILFYELLGVDLPNNIEILGNPNNYYFLSKSKSGTVIPKTWCISGAFSTTVLLRSAIERTIRLFMPGLLFTILFCRPTDSDPPGTPCLIRVVAKGAGPPGPAPGRGLRKVQYCHNLIELPLWAYGS
jgi:hypothetical protein